MSPIRSAVWMLAGILVFSASSRGDVALASAPVQLRTVTVAVVQDGTSEAIDAGRAVLQREMEELDSARCHLRFKQAPAFDAGWTAGFAPAALQAALDDPAVDFVLAVGPQVITAAADSARPLTKPVIGAILTDADLQPQPVDDSGRSTKPNFAVVSVRERSVESLRELQAILPFSSLTVLADPAELPEGPAQEAWRARLERELGVPVSLAGAAATAEATLAALPAGARAVFLLPTPRMPAAERRALLSGLAALRLPAFSFLGQADVESGALAGLMPDATGMLARRTAVNLDQLISGAPASGLVLTVPVQPQLFVNEATAGAVGAPIDFRILTRSRLVGAPAGETGPLLTFEQAVLTALEKNFDVRIRREATAGSKETERMAGSTLYPQLAATYGYQRVDRDRALYSGGLLPQDAQRAGLVLQQALLDDEAWSRRRAAREAYRAAAFQEQAERLAAVERVAQAYLVSLSAQALSRIAGENLEVTQRNLELAHLRRQVGISGPEEGLRFESLEAQQRSELIAARARVEQARIALNRVLSVPPESRWASEDVGLAHPAFSFASMRVVSQLRSRAELDRFRDFGTAYALRHSPEIAATEQATRAQSIVAGQKARRSYVPKVGVTASYQRVLENEYAGTTILEQLAVRRLISPPTIPLDKDEWNLGVTASLPLFTGGGVRADARKARSDLRQLELTADNVREAVAARAQVAFYALESSYPSIDLAQQSADRAQQNLRVVQDKYEQGTVSIINLLDAQNAAFAQKQAAALAVYRFLGDLVAFQRALGWFEVLSTPAEKEAWFREMSANLKRD